MQRGHVGARVVHRNEQGFTLLELMMVVLIIAILIAVLMPVVAGATTRAKDRATQTTLNDAVKAAKVVYSDKADYTSVQPDLPTVLSATVGQNSLVFVDDATSPTGIKTVSVAVTGAGSVVMSALSKSGTCFYVSDDSSTGTVYAHLGGSGGCAAGGAPLPGDAAWKTSW
jgi:type IV pilus assembly protein PilA